MAEGRRSERVGEAVLREMSELLIKDLRDPRLRGITLTGVKMDDDLRHGRVYFSHLEGSVRAAEAIAGFKSAAGFIRRQMGKALGLRYTPELVFEFDPGLERAARIDALLKGAAPK
ncbi:MAG: 30S ribosome-binding factor RbfA [Candidatus Binatus sp.]|uniref:30S ribosome-binding factor RbfA n=1 Tax=Candidatus Binatus sp. TaxID=2811406 RepID=UPI00271AAE23|nr:30S ribosome-binding factor RbfA [Candidatus Binatus sp.]MDO8434172.1 30S ribosome-binding factor RbfA [Candidatus Binatus sp.]